MRQRIDLNEIWEKSLLRTSRDLKEEGFLTVDLCTVCPFTFSMILDERFDVDALVVEIRLASRRS